MTVRVLLADDHTMLREALRTMLERDADIEVVAEAGDAAEALRLVGETAPDIVVMDIAMPGMNGIGATRELLARYPGVRVIALSAYSDKRFVLEMLNAGANGYINKGAAGSELLRAIRAVTQGQTYLCPEVSAAVVETVRDRGANGRGDSVRLGKREREVLKLLAQGMSSPQIGRRLHIAPGTVDVHRRNIMRKLDLHSVAELTQHAIRTGLIEV